MIKDYKKSAHLTKLKNPKAYLTKPVATVTILEINIIFKYGGKMNQKRPLKGMLIEDLGSTILKEFSRRMPIIYQESISRSIKDDAIDGALKSYCFGQTRYALVQSLFLSVGRECGYQAKVVRCETNGFPIPIVKIGKFNFTTHHGFDNDEQSAINVSLIRKQHSQINHDYIQPKLFGHSYNEKKLLAAEEIYANIIYGCHGDGQDFKQFGFLRIAVPYLKNFNGKEKLMFAENIDFFEILRAVVEKEQIGQEQKTIVNVAKPKLKIPNV